LLAITRFAAAAPTVVVFIPTRTVAEPFGAMCEGGGVMITKPDALEEPTA